MKKACITCMAVLILAASSAYLSSARADDTPPATLADVHKTLLEAAGYQSVSEPTPAQQTELLNKALKMIEQIPHVYHGQLKGAARSINAALSELSTGDPAHKAKEDIYNADDLIKSIM